MIKSRMRNLYKIEIPTLKNLNISFFSKKFMCIFLKLKKKSLNNICDAQLKTYAKRFPHRLLR